MILLYVLDVAIYVTCLIAVEWLLLVTNQASY